MGGEIKLAALGVDSCASEDLDGWGTHFPPGFDTSMVVRWGHRGMGARGALQDLVLLFLSLSYLFV